MTEINTDDYVAGIMTSEAEITTTTSEILDIPMDTTMVSKNRAKMPTGKKRGPKLGSKRKPRVTPSTVPDTVPTGSDTPKIRANYGPNEDRRECMGCGSTLSTVYTTRTTGLIVLRYRTCSSCGKKRVTREVLQ